VHEHVPPEHVPKVARRTTPARHEAATSALTGSEDALAGRRLSVALLQQLMVERAARQTEHGEALRGESSKMGRVVAPYLLRPASPFPSTVAPTPSPLTAPVPPPAALLAALSGLGRLDDSAGIRRATDAGRTECPSTTTNVSGRDGENRRVAPPPPTDLVPSLPTLAPAGLRRGRSYAADGVRRLRPSQRRPGS